MQIKSIQKTTLIDYPGLIAATIFVGGCNFRCDYCYNKTLVLNPSLISSISEESILLELESRKNLIEGVVITGGEPTIQKGLKEFIIKVRSLGFKIKLDSNGYLPKILEDFIDSGILDYIAMDVKGPLHKYKEIVGVDINTDKILDSIELIKNSGVDYEFRTTVWKNGFNEKDFLDIYGLIKGAKKYYIQNSYVAPSIPTTANFPSMSKKDILPVLELGKQHVGKVELRGSWY